MLGQIKGAPTRATKGVHCAAVACFCLLAACSDTQQQSQNPNTIVSGNGGIGGVASGGVGGSGGSGGGGTGGVGAAGSAGVAAGGSGGTGAGGMQAGSGGSPVVSDAGPIEDAAIDAAMTADAEPGDPEPTDYGARGPHEVLIENNVGATHRNTNVADDTARCAAFVALVGADADPETIERLTSYPADMDRQLYTMFRPAVLEDGAKYPVITWGNGTCSHPLLFSELLEHLASHGFIVVATNTRWTSGGVEMLRGLDFAVAENARAASPLFGKVDTAMLGVSGHSQGSMATVTAGADPRVVATVPIQGAGVAAARQLHSPTFLIAGELDTLVTPAGVEDAYDAVTVPAVYGLSMGQDHLMPGRAPAPILDAVTAWFKIHLAGDEEARTLFYGDDCTLCSDARWTLQRKNL
jgi:pimeloyl-ACP methyl ester carboxylesterase